MTPDTQPAPVGYRRPQIELGDGETTNRSGGFVAEPPLSRQLAAVAHPSTASSRARPGRRVAQRVAQRAARRAQEDASLVKVIPIVAVMVVTVAGIYIAWLKGSSGGGEGGVVGGAALLTAAVARLFLPAQLVGLLGTRKRVLDVITLAVFGACLLLAGLVLPS